MASLPIEDEVDDDESEGEDIIAAKEAFRTDRHRVDNEAFTQWITRKAEAETSGSTDESAIPLRDRGSSLRTMMAEQEGKRIMSEPREYQLELFERAKKNNIIAVLPTGSGKTLIAVLLLRHIIDEELESRRCGKQKKVAFFLVDKVALCFQQFAVLEANIGRPVVRICGDVNFDTYNRPSWQVLFDEHDVVVCTAQILYLALSKSFISTERISIMIFDEAHHCKKSHPYARIVKDFYIDTPLDSRPRLFGMSASPVDSKGDVEESASHLETLLHCQVATTADLGLLQQHNISKPEEMVISYPPPPLPYATRLVAELESKYRTVRAFSKLFDLSKRLASELGEWCANYLWSHALRDVEIPKLISQAEQEYRAGSNSQTLDALNSQIAQIREASKLAHSSTDALPAFKKPALSEKVLSFIKCVNELYQGPDTPRCLVFVQQRATATLLAVLLRNLGHRNLRLDVLVGVQSRMAGDQLGSVREQMLRILKFRQGELNLLIATSVAEEGLDIPDCNCVIRFDLYSTMIQYVQSRGRARCINSKFVSMVEDGNASQRRVIYEARKGEALMHNFCRTLPQDRLLEGNDKDVERLLAMESHLPRHHEDSGARLSFFSAIDCLAHFVQSIPAKETSILDVNYEMFFDGRGYTCEVTLPEGAPLHSVGGKSFRRKALAKRSAAFEACLLLRAKGFLNSELLPIYTKQLPALRNAHLALNVGKPSEYVMRTKPEVWARGRGTKPTRICVMIIQLRNQQALDRPVDPIALITRFQLPSLPPFPIYAQASSSTEVIMSNMGSDVLIEDTQLDKLASFTLTIFTDLFNKKYEFNPANMDYWLAPLRKTAQCGQEEEPLKKQHEIDWALLDHIHSSKEQFWNKEMPITELYDKFWIDRWDGGRRYFSAEVDAALNASDAVPQHCAPHKVMSSIIDYSVSLFKKSRKSKVWDMEQPVLRAYQIPALRNWLEEWPAEVKAASSLAYICPEPLRLSVLPVSIVAMGYAFPSIIHRIEAYLISREVVDLLGLEIPLKLSLEATTRDSDNSQYHEENGIQLQRGMGSNYERLEFIGDCFLKMATSISLYVKYAQDDEFESHVKRMVMICNKNLFKHALDKKLYEYIRSKPFNRRTWYPEGLKLLEGKGMNLASSKLHKHELGDKTVADVCEAIMGAALVAEREAGSMDMAVRAVSILVQNEDHDATSFSEYAAKYVPPAWIAAAATATQTDLVEQIARLDSYRFKQPRLLRSAFLHPSYAFAHERIPCYQRLEFLGDALLDMACVNFLFYSNPAKDPQWLTEHKMAMVSNRFLGALCVRLGFHRHLRHSNAALVHAVAGYVEELDEARRTAAGRPDYWLSARAAPKCLPDVVEAYVGALFVDAGFDFGQVERFFDRHILPFFRDVQLYDTFANRHPTTFLANVLQQRLGCSRFAVLADELLTLEHGRVVAGGCGVTRIAAAALVHGRVVGEAEASSVRSAKLNASKAAADKLHNLDRQTFRRQYKCDCREEDLPVDPDKHDRGDERSDEVLDMQGQDPAQKLTLLSDEDEAVHAIPAIGGLVAGNGRLVSEPTADLPLAE